jgi:AsmA protein
MNKPVKYFLIAAASLGILIIAGVLAVVMLVDVERYKPEIEQFVTEKTGYPLTLGGEIELSVFPWIGLSFTDLQLGNPDGFVSKNFVHVEDFQARLKVMPLLSRKVEISKFVVKEPQIYLEKNPKGIWNWQKLTESGSKAPSSEPTATPADGGTGETETDGFVLESLVVEEFSITDGMVVIDDLENKMKHEVSGFNLQLDDVSLDTPIKVSLLAQLDGKPISLNGTVGPVGTDPGAGKLNLDLVIQALDKLNVQTSGYVEDINGQMKYNLDLKVEPFSPKQLYSSLGMTFPVTTSDSDALEKVSMQAHVAGDTKQAVLSEAVVVLDDSSITLDATAKDFAKPDLALNLAVDAIDLDRYLPPAGTEKTPAPGKSTTESAGKPSSKDTAGTSGAASSGKTASGRTAEAGTGIDYEPLRKLVLKANMKVGEMKVHGGTLNNLALDLAGRNGIFTINSFGTELYEGNIAATGNLNVQKNMPVSALDLVLQNVQVGPLLKDFAKKEIIEGVLKAEIDISMKGDNADRIKKSLNGKGDLVFQDGALIGLDLAQMARNIKSGFTLEQQGERPKTDFAELHVPFTITNGLVNTSETAMRSPFIRVTATGDVNLVNEALDLKVKPTLVGTIKGQGDEAQRSGLTIPVLVGGTFDKPKFTADLESLVKERMPTEEELGEMIKSGKIPAERKEQFEKEVEEAKGLLKGLFGN